MQSGERGDQGGRLVPVLAQGGNERRVLRGDTVLAHGAEHPVGAQLQEGRDSQVLQTSHPFEEADGLTDVPHPVLGVAQFIRSGCPAGDVGDDPDCGLVEGQGLRDRTEVVEHGVHAG